MVKDTMPQVSGLTGRISDVRVAVDTAAEVGRLDIGTLPADIDLQRMAGWAMNYLIRSPRPELDYEPVFQCHPLRCPPLPPGSDPVVACDTDARMDWEWYYMREITGSTVGRGIEAAFHERMRRYIGPDGRVWSHPGCYNEDRIDAVYSAADKVIHIWGATKILKSLSEDYTRTGNPTSKDLARKVMLALKQIAIWDTQGRCWFAGGMGALRPDGTPVPNGWNRQPAPIVEPLVTYYLATGDEEGLAFAQSYADGIINNLQPGGLHFEPGGGFGNGHSHATMHALWGVAHLGLVIGHDPYLRFARGAWDYLLSRGTGTGWFPAGPDTCNETCCLSDMMSVAALIGQGGTTAYFDYLERYLRNYISPLQFILTPEFEDYYRRLNAAAGDGAVRQGLRDLERMQGAIIGGSGLNDFENDLLGGTSGFEMFGCCAPEGMRAIYTAWTTTIQRLPRSSALGPAGVYVHLSLSRDSEWGRVVSFLPEQGRLTVLAHVRDAFFLRPPHWAPREAVRTFVDGRPIAPRWSGDYVRFDAAAGSEVTMTYPVLEWRHEVEGLWPGCAPDLSIAFRWRGNAVVAADPHAQHTPLFTEGSRSLPPPPSYDL